MAPISTTMPQAWTTAFLGYELYAEARHLNPGTIENRRSAVRHLARWLEDEHGITDPKDVTKLHVQLAMKKAYGERARSGARTHFNDLKAFFSWFAEEHGAGNPVTGIPRPKDVSNPPDVLTEAEIGRLLKATSGRDFESVRMNAIVHVLLETGMRRAELCNLDLDDVDLKARTLWIANGKGGKPRTVVFGPATATALLRMIRSHPGGDGSLFTSAGGKRMADCTVGLKLRELGAEAGVPGLHAHRFRHTWTHYMLASGAQEHNMMHLGGWSSTTQLGRYGAALAAQRAIAAGRATPVLALVAGGGK